MNYTVIYSPTIIDGAVVRFKFGDAEISASRNGVMFSGYSPLLKEEQDINEIFLKAFDLYYRMNQKRDQAHEIAKEFVNGYSRPATTLS